MQDLLYTILLTLISFTHLKLDTSISTLDNLTFIDKSLLDYMATKVSKIKGFYGSTSEFG